MTPSPPPSLISGAVMAGTVFIMSLLVERLWEVLPGSPYFASLASVGMTGGIMLFGGVIAFLMVWTEFKVIQVGNPNSFVHLLVTNSQHLQHISEVF